MYRNPVLPGGWKPGHAGFCSVVAGIDPSGGRASWGVARLRRVTGGLWGVDFITEIAPQHVFLELPRLLNGVSLACIDAPLSPGEGTTFRPHERAAIRVGARLLPLTAPGMEALSRTGMALARLLGEAGIRVLETHPGSVKDNILFASACANIDSHALDATIAGVVCAMYCEGKGTLFCSRRGCIALTFSKALLTEGGGRFECIALT